MSESSPPASSRGERLYQSASRAFRSLPLPVRILFRATLTLGVAYSILWVIAASISHLAWSAVQGAALSRDGLQRMVRHAHVVESVADLRIPVDTAITPRAAGEILQRLLYGPKAPSTGDPAYAMQPLAQRFASGGQVRPVARNGNAHLKNLSAEAILAYSRERSDINNVIAEYPRIATLSDGTNLISLLARAGAADIFSTRYDIKEEVPLMQFEFIFPRVGGLKSVAHAQLAFAAWHLEDGNAAEALRLSRELYSASYVLQTASVTPIEHLVASMIARRAMHAMAASHHALGNHSTAERIERALGDTLRSVPIPDIALDPTSALATLVNREDIPTAFKWEMLGYAHLQQLCAPPVFALRMPSGLSFRRIQNRGNPLLAHRASFVKHAGDDTFFRLYANVPTVDGSLYRWAQNIPFCLWNDD